MTCSDNAAAPWVHPQARVMLDRIAASGEPPLETLAVADARRIADERVIRTNIAGEPVHEVRDVTIAGPGGALRLRIYKPSRRSRAAGAAVFARWWLDRRQS